MVSAGYPFRVQKLIRFTRARFDLIHDSLRLFFFGGVPLRNDFMQSHFYFWMTFWEEARLRIETVVWMMGVLSLCRWDEDLLQILSRCERSPQSNNALHHRQEPWRDGTAVLPSVLLSCPSICVAADGGAEHSCSIPRSSTHEDIFCFGQDLNK